MLLYMYRPKVKCLKAKVEGWTEVSGRPYSKSNYGANKSINGAKYNTNHDNCCSYESSCQLLLLLHIWYYTSDSIF